MASWEDGPEYAPIERPAEFDPAVAAPLDVAPPYRQAAAEAPQQRPQFDGPAVALAPLGSLVPDPGESLRDPNRPFEVVASTMTDASTGPSAWGAARGSALAAVAPTWGPPTGMPATVPPLAQPAPSRPGSVSWPGPNWPAPTEPMQLSSGAAPSRNGFPAPGTDAWFGYGAPPPPEPNGTPTAKALAQAVTPPVIIFLVLTVIYPLAPIFFVVAWALASKIKIARRAVLRSFGAALAAILLFFVIFLSASDGTTGWYTIFTRTTMFFSLVELVVTGLLVWRELKRQPPPYDHDQYPPLRSPWG